MKNTIIKYLGKLKDLLNTYYKVLSKVFQKAVSTIRPVFKKFCFFIKKYYFVLSKKEKSIIGLLLVVLLANIYLLAKSNNEKNTVLAPDRGGIFIEGAIGKKAADFQQTIDKLTKVGLVRFDLDGKLVPDLASSWEITNLDKNYTFRLRDFVNSTEIVSILNSKKDIFQNINIKNPDEHTVEFDLSQPYSPFLASLTTPYFPYGPYKIEKETKTEIRLSVNNDFYLGVPNIETIVLRFYPDEENILRAFKQKEIDGIAQIDNSLEKKGYNNFQMKLPQWQVLFFNLNRDVFKEKSVRQNLANNKKLDKNIEVTLVTSNKEPYISEASNLKTAWSALGATIQIVSRDPLELQKDIIPKRDYDLLLYGVDYGTDPDPYPFWHSSQNAEAGLNLSGFANIDADKLLEEARLTTDWPKRQELYAKFQQIMDDERPAMFIKQTEINYIISSKVKGIIAHDGINPSDRYSQVWTWYIIEKRVKK